MGNVINPQTNKKVLLFWTTMNLPTDEINTPAIVWLISQQKTAEVMAVIELCNRHDGI